MFEDLYDACSFLLSFTWPTGHAEITDMYIEETTHRARHSDQQFRLIVCYRFFVADDGPYSGIDYWKPTWSYHQIRRIKEARKNLKLKHTVPVRYRRDDPSLNHLDSDAWRGI